MSREKRPKINKSKELFILKSRVLRWTLGLYKLKTFRKPPFDFHFSKEFEQKLLIAVLMLSRISNPIIICQIFWRDGYQKRLSESY